MAALSIVLSLCTVPTARAAEAALEGPLRILVVGDSVSQGSAGDWTWRYRLWQHLTSTGTDVDFVGPRSDLWDDISRAHGSQAYVDPDFDRDHAARWGATLAFFPATDQPIDELVTTYAPDVVIEMLGFNDLVFLQHEPAEVAARTRDFVATARSADPDVEVVLGHLTQTWVRGVDELNDRLDALAGEVDDPSSRVVTAAVDDGFSEHEDTWDRSHPNSRGELRIAAAMADALAVLELAQPHPRPLETLPRGPRKPPEVSVTASDGAALLSWTGPPGADREVVRIRDVTLSGEWVSLTPPGASSSYTVGGLTNGHTYAVQLEPVKGWWVAEPDSWSPVLRVRPLPPVPGAVRLTRVTSPGRGLVRVVATADARATSYELDLAPTRSCAKGRVRFTRHRTLDRPRTTLSTPAPFIRVRVAAHNMAGSGPVSDTSQCLRVR